MTRGQQAVWAAAFALALHDDLHESVACSRAALAVLAMRGHGARCVARHDNSALVDEALVMLDDMNSTGADR